MMEWQPTEIRPFPPHTYTAYASSPLDIVERVLSCLKATIKADFSHPEIQRRMDSRKEAKASGIPQGEFEHNNCLKLCTET